ncbi:hypothetical protein ETD86_29615 [Nonomuraea turkmeniaca]|uniref:Uncharacterized protein n=1 Tax=Nonomuraea turkmeniaca TaxID=103838 RepID=A0A5S4FA64_9ACTN|nr:hypothetical protein [Nonomuraea turkmeniaca]TMR14106.1 hypothetical protein ETD86_29615 [Nonomuraea turkmeniaca]
MSVPVSRRGPRPPVTINDFTRDGDEQDTLAGIFAAALYAAANDHDEDASVDRHALMRRFSQFVPNLDPYQ